MKWKKEQTKDGDGELSADEKSFIGCEKENILLTGLGKENADDVEKPERREAGNKDSDDTCRENDKNSNTENGTVISTKTDDI